MNLNLTVGLLLGFILSHYCEEGNKKRRDFLQRFNRLRSLTPEGMLDYTNCQ
ncbi:hypothetical protein HM1_1509 [Heliomicrobium modesticaldum Ice1]|uniref:Uncharacterized protein n=1 Tax=Heliobacterium modesticaldum (strain ATCC 51547 / Ice1) TaxID=498761 RepID=B0TCQ5_HELMI|nr:hypothetical protein HM1_1509 [Heliomicrobium modesticaldum Ice1]